jgi:hypothetical protein
MGARGVAGSSSISRLGQEAREFCAFGAPAAQERRTQRTERERGFEKSGGADELFLLRVSRIDWLLLICRARSIVSAVYVASPLCIILCIICVWMAQRQRARNTPPINNEIIQSWGRGISLLTARESEWEGQIVPIAVMVMTSTLAFSNTI